MGKDKSRAAAEAAAELAEEARQRAEEAFEAAQSAVEDGFDDAHRYLRRQWRDRPVAVAATALGVGIVLGVLIGGRR